MCLTKFLRHCSRLFSLSFFVKSRRYCVISSRSSSYSADIKELQHGEGSLCEVTLGDVTRL